MVKNLLFVALFGLISGCGSMYVAKEGYEPHGYSEQKIDATTYIVTYETYKSLGLDDTFNFVLKRSSELAQSNSFKAFKVLSRNDETSTELVNVPEVVGTVLIQGEGLSQMGNQTGVIVPAYTREFLIKKSSAKISFTDAIDSENTYVVEELIRN